MRMALIKLTKVSENHFIEVGAYRQREGAWLNEHVVLFGLFSIDWAYWGGTQEAWNWYFNIHRMKN